MVDADLVQLAEASSTTLLYGVHREEVLQLQQSVVYSIESIVEDVDYGLLDFAVPSKGVRCLT